MTQQGLSTKRNNSQDHTVAKCITVPYATVHKLPEMIWSNGISDKGMRLSFHKIACESALRVSCSMAWCADTTGTLLIKHTLTHTHTCTHTRIADGAATCQGYETRKAQPVGQSNELHGVQFCHRRQMIGVQVLQDRLHTHPAGIGEIYLETHTHRTEKSQS